MLLLLQTKIKMAADNCKVLIAVIFLTATSLLALGASVGGPKSTLEVLIYHVIPQKVSNAPNRCEFILVKDKINHQQKLDNNLSSCNNNKTRQNYVTRVTELVA